ncbi:MULTISPECIES: hypothetical protein [unclassified Caballeronia]|uniref:hypothetical protein n=1 Tax=unclassified Caballeronia TaxID=2646786 RepID=UPI002857E9CE|nr:MULTISPECIES: hypothetical protein [unclassified Caballeronia]MDR5777717.1 hypothetical protein [Caballeronia sp. LZ002]MDR5798883.1 hypothetical protein [Caballeronia sp. LZ001]MDR5853154.1 hypothetical protein [Caballeronia sp. LZ003]
MVTALSTRTPLRPEPFRLFVDNMRQAVEAKGLSWHIPLDDNGTPLDSRDWDLRKLNNSHDRHSPGTVGFGIDDQVREMAINAQWPKARLPSGSVLPEVAQDFIKATIASLCLRGRTADSTQIIAKAARRLLSCTVVPPFELSREHFEAVLSLKPWSAKAKRDFSVVARIIDENLLSVNCPVQPELVTPTDIELLPDLHARASAHKLPDKDALFELTRIVFQETPTSFNDGVFFAILKLVILTGLRITEVLTLPDDCLVWDEHIDVVTGRNVADVGGVGRSLRLRYYAEKQRNGAPDLLVEKYYYVPSKFEAMVEATVSETLIVTAPLRALLKSQSSRLEIYPCSDIRTFRTSTGRTVGTWHRLFLTLGGVFQFPLQKSLASDTAISTPLSPRVYMSLGRATGNGSLSFFRKYGRSPQTKEFSVQPHALRHLMNTELFRQDVPDTAITHQFGRVTVAQSYEYDHRSLAEKLKFVQLPAVCNSFAPPGSTQAMVAKMVVSGVAASSHLGQSFKRIQGEHGDEAAFAYLAANSDGFHVTPYGFCTNSFSMNPCARHLKCFDGCRHFAASGLPEHRVTLETLRGRLVEMRAAAEAKSARTIGRKNQITHAERLIRGVQAALDSEPDWAVFPEGDDYADRNQKDLFA